MLKIGAVTSPIVCNPRGSAPEPGYSIDPTDFEYVFLQTTGNPDAAGILPLAINLAWADHAPITTQGSGGASSPESAVIRSTQSNELAHDSDDDDYNLNPLNRPASAPDGNTSWIQIGSLNQTVFDRYHCFRYDKPFPATPTGNWYFNFKLWTTRVANTNEFDRSRLYVGYYDNTNSFEQTTVSEKDPFKSNDSTDWGQSFITVANNIRTPRTIYIVVRAIDTGGGMFALSDFELKPFIV